MKVVVAPNSFKGSLSAAEAAAAIARGVREVLPDAEVIEIPVADGGEGTVDALVSSRKGTYREIEVEGPLGDPVRAKYGLIDGGRTGVVELASASGLTLIPVERQDPRRASTYGFGQLLEAVRRQGVASIIAGIGGSATNDGGAGMAQALGYRLLEAGGRNLPRGGAALARLDRIDRSGFELDWRSVSLMVASDVTNPLTGPQGATYVYGPQKGADPDAVREFDQALDGARLVITGEGRVDGQTAFGKAPGEVAKRANSAGIPTLLLAGSRGPGWESLSSMGVTSVVTLAQEGDPEGHNLQVLMHHAAPALTRAASRAVQEML